MTPIFLHLYLSSSILCGLLALGLLKSRGLQTLSARLLGVNYLLYAIQSLLALVILTLAWEAAMILRPIVAMTLGPALYFYYLSLVSKEIAFKPVQFLHLVPALLLAVVIIFKLPFLWLIDPFIIGNLIIYLGALSVILLGGVSRLSHLAQYAGAAYRWLVVLAVLMFINLLVEILAFVEISSGTAPSESGVLLGGAILFLLFNAVALALVITRAPLMEWMHALQDLRLIKPAPLEPEEAERIFATWHNQVISRALYKREGGLTLEQAGRILGIPARQISLAVNRVYGSSFSQYLNDCRVKEAQRLLVDQPDLPITMLMLEAGFTTKSNFNKEFQRVTGGSPSEYRRRAQEN